MESVFLEIIFNAKDLVASGFEGRDEIDDPLHDALMDATLGEVTGGGGGLGVSIVDVEIEDEQRFNEALALIQRILRSLNVPNSTIIKRYQPSEITFSVYGYPS